MQIIRDPQAFWESFNNCTPKTGLLIYGEGKLLKQLNYSQILKQEHKNASVLA